MKHRSNEVKRKHHRQLIMRFLEVAFAGCEVEERPVDVGALFWAVDVVAHQRYQLRVWEPVLVDDRPDDEIKIALDRAVALMRDNPGRDVSIVFEGGEIEVRLPDEE